MYIFKDKKTFAFLLKYLHLGIVIKMYDNNQNNSVLIFLKFLFIKLFKYSSELLLERYIYSRNTQKQLKITNYVRNKSFLEFYSVYNGVWLKLLRSLS